MSAGEAAGVVGVAAAAAALGPGVAVMEAEAKLAGVDAPVEPWPELLGVERRPGCYRGG